MTHLILPLLFCCGILFSSCHAQGEQTFEQAPGDPRPVIGIYTEPSLVPGYPASSYQYIASSYVKFLEQSGARVVPVYYDSDKKTLDDVFSKINGLLFPGGDVEISKDNLFTQNAEYLINKTIEANRNGDYFPLWGTCLGFEMIHVIIGKYAPDILTKVDDISTTHSIYIIDEGQIYKDMPNEMIMSITFNNVYYYNHEWGVLDSTYYKYPELHQFFKITAYSQTNYTIHGIQFVASAEAYRYPIYTTMYHPEKMFEWKVPSNHSKAANKAQTYISNFFVNETRKNKHVFPEPEIQHKGIWNYPSIMPDTALSFSQVYILPNFVQKLEGAEPKRKHQIDFL